MIKVNGKVITQGQFPDGTLLMKFRPETDSKPAIVEWLYESDAELFTLICVKGHLDRIVTGKDIMLSLPYIPHARQDRVKSDEDVFTLKYFCETINSLGFKKVFVTDAHSNVSLALIDNVVDWGVAGYIERAIELSKAEALFFPDEGAMKRYSEQSPLSYAFGMKKRDWKTGQILGLDIINSENIVGKDVLIVDDICSRGGTFYHSAKALKAAGAKSVSLYVTHLEKTVTIGDLPNSGFIDHIYTTKSIFPDEELKTWGDWISIIN